MIISHEFVYVSFLASCDKLSCLWQMMLTKSGTLSHVIGWTNFLHLHIEHGFCQNFKCFTDLSSILFYFFMIVVEPFSLQLRKYQNLRRLRGI